MEIKKRKINMDTCIKHFVQKIVIILQKKD